MSVSGTIAAASHEAAIRQAADRLEGDSIALLQALIEAGEGGQAAIDSIVAGRMRELDCEVEVIDYDPAAVPMIDEFAARTLGTIDKARCVIGRAKADVDGTSAGGRSLILFAHPDTELFRPDPEWRSHPFVPEIREGRLFGWGVADDLAGVAALLQGLAVLKEAGLGLGGDVALVSAPSKKHARGISAALHGGLHADAAVYLHPAESGRGLAEIKAFAPGQLEFRITVQGKVPETNEPAHTAFAHRGVNPLTSAMRVVEALQAFDTARGMQVSHPRLQAAIGRSTNLMLTHCSYGDPAFPMRMGPDCMIGGAISLVPGEKLEAMMAEIEEAVAAAAAQDEWLSRHKPRIEWLAGVSAAETSSEAAIYKIVADAIGASGTIPYVNPLHTSSDIRNPIIQKNIPTVGYGPLCGGLAMSGLADEWVDLADYVRTIRVTANVIAAWCGLRR